MKITKIKKDINIKKYLCLFLIGIILNCAGRFLAQQFQLPFWLDTVGTCICAYYLGIISAVMVSVVPVMILGFSSYIMFLYSIIGVSVAVAIWWCVQKGFMDTLFATVTSGFVIGFIATVLATPINNLFNNGYIGNAWGDAFYEMLEFMGMTKVVASFIGDAVVDIIDKQISMFLGYILIHYVFNNIRRYYRSINRNKILTGILCILIVSATIISNAQNVCADKKAGSQYGSQDSGSMKGNVEFADYVKLIYNNTNGLSSSEANAIAQTDDGYIWIGSYAGLTRYDGTDFEYITEGSMSNVTTMMTDSAGRLWIGTNDSGIAIYDHGKFAFYDKKDGLPANSVRNIVQSADGDIYIATTGKMCTVDSKMEFQVLQNDVLYAMQLTAASDGTIAGVDNTGRLFFIEDGKVVYEDPLNSDVLYTSVMADESEYYVGTSQNKVLKGTFYNSSFYIDKTVSTDYLENFASLSKDTEGRIWLCAENGIGYWKNGNIDSINYIGFDSSIETMMQDYEGNYWFTSSRYGVMKMCRNNFSDLYTVAGVKSSVANAVTEYKGVLYCATDEGIDIIDKKSYKLVFNAVQKYVGDTRVRDLYVDSDNNLWICCYGGRGLVCYDHSGKITSYNQNNSQTTGDRFRCIEELSDGTIVAGTSDGLTYIKDGKVVKTLGCSDGLETAQILCLYVADDDTVYAGSDGSGIYKIVDGKVSEIFTEKNGLSSLIVLRMTPYDGGLFIVTSNSIEYMHKQKVTRIEDFPYFNNYDVVIYGSSAWVLSSCGIFQVDAKSLARNEDISYKLYDTTNGLINSITANSWTYVDSNANMYFCCNMGVEKFSLTDDVSYKGSYKMQISEVFADGKIISPVGNVFILPSHADRIVIRPSVHNYTLQNVKVKFYIEGLNDKNEVVDQNDLTDISYTGLQYGEYTVHLEIMDNDEKTVLQEQTYRLVKQAQMWEKLYFKIYLIAVLAWLLVFVTAVIINLRNMSKQKVQLEHMRQELTEKVDEQTREIREQSKKMTKMQWGVIESMASLIESRDGNTGEHVKNTREYVKMITREMYRLGMHSDQIDKKFVQNVQLAAPLHDVGKIRVSDIILNKPGKFTEDEYNIMKTHAADGGKIVRDILGQESDKELLKIAENIASYHHERWDGLGYSAGLKGDEIPLEARIMAVADVFDALVSKRVYKEAVDIDSAYDEIVKESGRHFDPEIVSVFCSIRPKIEKYLNNKK